jgi:hypothetical protein
VLIVQVEDWSSAVSHFVMPPSNYFEEQEKFESASLKHFKLLAKRIKRVHILYENMFKKIDALFKWIYPAWTKFCLVVIMFLMIFTPSDYVFSVLLLLVLLFCIS